MKSYSDNIVDTAALEAANAIQDEKIAYLQKEINYLKILGGLLLADIVVLNVIFTIYFT